MTWSKEKFEIPNAIFLNQVKHHLSDGSVSGLIRPMLPNSLHILPDCIQVNAN